VWRVYACHTPQKPGFFKLFRELLIVCNPNNIYRVLRSSTCAA
jgi:hypothetical protein